jgi:hypothetical protein
MLMLRFARTTPAAEARAGRVVVEGRVVADRTCPLAFSPSRPVWFEMTVEAYQSGSRGRGRPMWIPQQAEEKIVPFSVEDGTGRVRVAAEQGGYRVGGARREVGQAGQKGNRRYVAQIIAVGDVVRVRGVADPGEDGSAVLRATPEQPLEILLRRAGR